MLGLQVAGRGVVVDKPDPFTADNGKKYCKVKLGFVGGCVVVETTVDQFDRLGLGDEIECVLALNHDPKKGNVARLDKFKGGKAAA
jgi:hypothetical protein